MPAPWAQKTAVKEKRVRWRPGPARQPEKEPPGPPAGGQPRTPPGREGARGGAPPARPAPAAGAGPDYGIVLTDQEALQKAFLEIGDELKTIKAELAELRRQNETLVKDSEYQDFINMAVGMASAKRRNSPEAQAEFARLAASLPPPGAAAQGVPTQQFYPPPEPPGPEPAAPPTKKKKSVGSKVANAVFYLCMVLLIVGAALFARSTDPQKSLFGFRYYYIKSASMAPVYPVGSVVITRSVLPEEVQVGDDITIYVSEDGGDTYLTHRVVEITTDSAGELAFRTRGVNNKTNDPSPYNAKLVVGRVVFCIPMLGTVMTFVSSQLPLVIGMFVLLIALAFMLKLLFTKEEPEKAPPPEQKPKRQARARREKAPAPPQERVVWKAGKQEEQGAHAP